jgi:hypothetical protein
MMSSLAKNTDDVTPHLNLTETLPSPSGQARRIDDGKLADSDAPLP